MSSVPAHTGRCCPKNGPCRRSYVDYGTYLKNRKCVGPSDLCTLQYKIEHGHLGFGCISQSGGLVRIDCNLEVNANNSIKLNSGQTITQTAEEFVEIIAGHPACPLPTSGLTAGDVSIEAANNLRAVGENLVHIQAGCTVCSDASYPDAAPGTVTVAANANIEAMARGNVRVEAGCGSGCVGGTDIGDQSGPYAKGLFAGEQLCALGTTGTWLQSGCAACTGGPPGFSMTDGPTGGQMLLNAQGDLAALSMGSAYLWAGCCTGQTGTVNICGPAGVAIHSSLSGSAVTITGPSGTWTASGPSGLTLSASAGPIEVSAGANVDISGTEGVTVTSTGGGITMSSGGKGGIELATSDPSGNIILSTAAPATPTAVGATINLVPGGRSPLYVTNNVAQILPGTSGVPDPLASAGGGVVFQGPFPGETVAYGANADLGTSASAPFGGTSSTSGGPRRFHRVYMLYPPSPTSTILTMHLPDGTHAPTLPTGLQITLVNYNNPNPLSGYLEVDVGSVGYYATAATHTTQLTTVYIWPGATCTLLWIGSRWVCTGFSAPALVAGGGTSAATSHPLVYLAAGTGIAPP